MTIPKNSWQVYAVAAAAGVCTGAALCLLGGLSPLAAADRPALALWAVCASLPLGAALGTAEPDAGKAGLRAGAALVAGAMLALVATVGDAGLLWRTASWCGAAALIGATLAGVARAGGVLATLIWLALCGLPFFCGKLGEYSTLAEGYALQVCPWLGFSHDALGGDPLRRTVIYLGQWSSLGDKPAFGLLAAAELWLAALLALAANLLRAGLPKRDAPAL